MIDNRRKSVDAYMPLWIGDYLADTTHLTTEQHGAYLLLLMAYWRKGGPLPADEPTLARIAKMTTHKWKAVRAVMVALFVEEDGVWRSKRADAELAKANALKAARSASGRRGAEVSNANRTGQKTYIAPHAVNERVSNSLGGFEQKGLQILEGGLSAKSAELSHVNLGNADALPSAKPQPSPSPIRTRTEGGDSSDLLRSNPVIQNQADSLLVRAEPEPTVKPASKPISSKVQRGTRWPAGQPVPDDWLAKAAANWAIRGLPVEAIAIEAEKFVAHWTAKAGKDATKVDWSAAWRTWYLNAYGVKANGRSNGQHGRPGEAGDVFLEGYLNARAERLERETPRH